MATATKQKRPIRPIISRSVGDAAGQTVLDALDAGYSIDELTGPDRGPKIRPRQKHDQAALDQMVSLSSKGGPIPGQSLTSDPEQPRPWEKPPTYTNPREALMYISTLIPYSKKQLIQGVQEIELNYKNKLKFKDKLTCIIL